MVGKVTYTSWQITKVIYQQEVNGTIPSNAMLYEFDLTYDFNGKINYTTCHRMLGSVQSFDSEYTYVYDGAGKMTQILEKKKMAGIYTHFTNYIITHTGDNMTKIETVTGITSSTGVPDMSTAITVTYEFTGYDSKINSYTTLPKSFFVTWGLLHPQNLSTLSANNGTSFNVINQGSTPISGSYTYLCDSQNYPVSDQTQTQKYIYKAL